MKRFLIGLMVAAVAVIGFGGVGAFAGANGGLQAFGTGTVTITGVDSATIVNASGQFGGVYIQSKTQSGMPLSAVNFSFVSFGDVTGGAPRFSLPINTDGGGGSVGGTPSSTPTAAAQPSVRTRRSAPRSAPHRRATSTS